MKNIFIAVKTAQKMKFLIKDFFSKYDQIRWKLRIWSHLLKKSLIENFFFCAMKYLFCCSKVNSAFPFNYGRKDLHNQGFYTVCTTPSLRCQEFHADCTPSQDVPMNFEKKFREFWNSLNFIETFEALL